MQTLILFVSLTMLAAAASGQTPAAAQLGWQMAIHERTFEHATLGQCISNTAALGLHHMSLSGRVKLDDGTAVACWDLSDAQIAAIKAQLKEKDIKLVNAYVSFPANEKVCRKQFEFARKMGFDILVGEPGPEALDTVEKLAKEFNVKVAIHDHPRPSHYWNPDSVLAAIKGRSPLLGACADTGHWVRSGLDPVECLKKLEGHVFTLHFKDLAENNPKSHDVPWGTGVSNCKGMMEELKRQGFHGAFCVEYEYHVDSNYPEVAQCVQFFNKTCAELAAGKTQ